jgi:hypothetical protein
LHPESGDQQLFNLADDPAEMNDLIDTHGEIADRLTAELDQNMQFGEIHEEAVIDREMLEALRDLGYVE